MKKIKSPAFRIKEKSAQETLDELLNRGRKQATSRFLFGESIDPTELETTPINPIVAGNIQGQNINENPYFDPKESNYSVYRMSSPYADNDPYLQDYYNNFGYHATPNQEENYADLFNWYYGLEPTNVQFDDEYSPDNTFSYDDFTNEFDRRERELANAQAYGRIYTPQEWKEQGNQGDVPYPIASMYNNRFLYSDGTVRYGYPRYERFGETMTPEDAFLAMLGLEGQRITQTYNNPNNWYPSGRHAGIDIATKELVGERRKLKLPTDAVVHQILRNGQGDKGWGNSVIFRLPTGEFIRQSHLSEFNPNLRVGQVLRAGDYFGLPGSTGFSTGEHLDSTMYDANMGVINPFKSRYLAEYGGLKLAEGQPEAGSLADVSDEEKEWINAVLGDNNQTIQAEQPKNKNVYLESSPSFSSQAIQPKQHQSQQLVDRKPLQALSDLVQNTGELAKNVGTKASSSIETIKPTGDYIDAGISEFLRGDLPGSAAVRQATINNFRKIPEKLGKTAEELARQGSYIIEDKQPTGRNIDFGFSEALRGDLPGSAAVRQATVGNIGRKSQEIGKNLIASGKNFINGGMNIFNPPKAVAADLQQPIQAGSGIKQKVQEARNYYQGKTPSSVTAPYVKRVVGENSAGTSQELPLTSYSPAQSFAALSNPQDPFFKVGGAQKYAGMIKVGSDYRGALTPELFNDTFFENPENVKDVFGGTAYENQAAAKARELEARKYSNNFDDWAYQNKEDYKRDVDNYRQNLTNYLNSYESSAKGRGGDYQSLASIRSSVRVPYALPTEIYSKGAFYSPNRKVRAYSDIIGTKDVFNAFKPVSNKSSQSVFQASKPNYANYVSLDDYLKQGKTAQQYYAEIGQQNFLDQLGQEGLTMDNHGGIHGVGADKYGPGQENISAGSNNPGEKKGDVNWGFVANAKTRQSIPTTHYISPNNILARAQQDAAIAYNPENLKKSASQRAREKAQRTWRKYR